MARATRSGHLPGNITIDSVANLSGITEIPIDHQTMGGRGTACLASPAVSQILIQSARLLSNDSIQMDFLELFHLFFSASNAVEEDIEEMRAEERAQQSESHISTMELICSPTLRAPLIIGIVMQLSQQLSGINAVFYYSTSLFTSAGLTEENAKFANIGIGAIMVNQKHDHTSSHEFEFDFCFVIRIGCYDACIDTVDGSYRSKNSTFIWIRRNVYFFHFYNHFIFNKGKSQATKIHTLFRCALEN